MIGMLFPSRRFIEGGDQLPRTPNSAVLADRAFEPVGGLRHTLSLLVGAPQCTSCSIEDFTARCAAVASI